MKHRMTRWLPSVVMSVLTVALIAGCGDTRDPLTVGGKDFGESEVLSEMIATLAEEEEIRVNRRIGLGSTRPNLEALKRGDIDIYVEYNGTGLLMLGQPAMADGNAAMAEVRELYGPLGLHWADRLGFANNYGIVMQASRAEELGVASLSDLASHAGELVMGIDENFEARPIDGLQPLARRYGLAFNAVEVVPPADRPELYERLITGQVDVMAGFTTDGQLADHDLVVLADDAAFFPVYEAAPLVRREALERYPELADLLARLAGRLDESTMRDANRRVDLYGQNPAEVARSVLAELGLVEGEPARAMVDPLHLAASPAADGDNASGLALRATRDAFPGRQVTLSRSDHPLDAVGRGEARLALVGAQEFLQPRGREPIGNFEALGVVGETTLHLIALNDSVRRLEDAGTVAVGPGGSAHERVLAQLSDGLGLEATARHADDSNWLNESLLDSDVDIAVVMAPVGDSRVASVLEAGGRLISLDNWNQGNNRLRYPVLRDARIAAGSYPAQTTAAETLSAQLVLAAVGSRATTDVSERGMGATYSEYAEPISDSAVEALHGALGSRVDIDPALRHASVLTPRLPDPPAPLNPAPDMSFLNLISEEMD